MTGSRRHKCQSSLVRCALRGHHPRPVIHHLGDSIWAYQYPLARSAFLKLRIGSTNPTDAARAFARHIARKEATVEYL